MSEQSSNQPQRIAAGELDRRQHIIVKDAGMATVYTVEHSLAYRSGTDEMVALTLAPVGGGEPQCPRWCADYQVRLASEDEVADALYAARSAIVVKGLRAVADLIADCRVKIRPYGGSGIAVQVVDGEVTRLAEALELPLSDYGQTTKSATWKANVGDEYEDVSVTFYGKPAPEPEPVEAEQEWLFTFGSGQQHDGRFVRITGTHESARARMVEVFGTAWCDQYDWRRFDELGLPAVLTELPASDWPGAEHYHVAGAGGEAGACAAVCACGVTFAGFDTIAEAVVQLDKHIADPQPVEG